MERPAHSPSPAGGESKLRGEMETGGPAAHTGDTCQFEGQHSQTTTFLFSSRHLTLDAAQVQQVEVTGQDGLERGEGLQGRDAASFWQDGQRQDLVV